MIGSPLKTCGKEKGTSHKESKDAEKAETVDSHYIIPMRRKVITGQNVLQARAASADFKQHKAGTGDRRTIIGKCLPGYIQIHFDQRQQEFPFLKPPHTCPSPLSTQGDFKALILG